MTARTFAIGALAGGLLAGVLDIVYAFVWLGASGRTPEFVLQSVASGWLGRAAFTGGMGAAALGLASHLGISVGAAAVYGAAVRGSAWLRTHWIAGGIAFSPV